MDFQQEKMQQNEGECSPYYVKNKHEDIINYVVFNLVKLSCGQ